MLGVIKKGDVFEMKKRNLIMMATLFVFTLGTAAVFAKTNSEIKSEDLDSFTAVEVNVDTSNINIVKGDKYKIEIDYRQPKEKIDYKVKNNKLIITAKRNWNIFPEFGPQPYNVITVYAPDIDTVKFNSKSGCIKLEDFNVQNAVIKATYGNMNVKNSEIQDANVNTTFGGIKLEDSNVQNAVIKTTYGNVNMKNSKIQDANVSTTFGGININLVEQSNLKLKVVSGTIKVDGKIYEREYTEDNSSSSNINVKSDSGDITITHR